MQRTRKPPHNCCGPQVKLARIRLKMKQIDLSTWLEEWGVQLDQTAIVRIEKIQRNVYDYELVALAKALDVSTDWLLFGGDLLVEGAVVDPPEK